MESCYKGHKYKNMKEKKKKVSLNLYLLLVAIKETMTSHHLKIKNKKPSTSTLSFSNVSKSFSSTLKGLKTITFLHCACGKHKMILRHFRLLFIYFPVL